MRYGRSITARKETVEAPEVGFTLFKDETDLTWYTVDSNGNVEPFAFAQGAAFQTISKSYEDWQPNGTGSGTIDLVNIPDGNQLIHYFFQEATTFAGVDITSSLIVIKNDANSYNSSTEFREEGVAIISANNNVIQCELSVMDGFGPGVIDNLNAGELNFYYQIQPILTV